MEGSLLSPLPALGALMVGSLAEEKASDVLVPTQVSSGSLLSLCYGGHLDIAPAAARADGSQLSPWT